MFIPVSLAKRITSVLLLAGISHDRVSELTGSCDRSVRVWKKQIANGDTDKLLMIGSGAGRKSKFANIENQVLDEIEKGNYHTQQQIVDMVLEKFNVKVSLMAVSRLLKKRHQEAEICLSSCKSGFQRAETILRGCPEAPHEKNQAENSWHILLFMDASHFVMGG